jgi:hypothetical protein
MFTKNVEKYGCSQWCILQACKIAMLYLKNYGLYKNEKYDKFWFLKICAVRYTQIQVKFFFAIAFFYNEMYLLRNIVGFRWNKADGLLSQ